MTQKSTSLLWEDEKLFSVLPHTEHQVLRAAARRAAAAMAGMQGLGPVQLIEAAAMGKADTVLSLCDHGASVFLFCFILFVCF